MEIRVTTTEERQRHASALPAETLPVFAGRFARELRGFVGRRVPAQDADDVTQDVLLRLHESASGLRHADRWQAWAYSVARNAIADHYRRRPPDEAVEDVLLEAARDAALPATRGFGCYEGDHDVHEEVLGWLRPTAESLPERYRRALIMADFEGVPQREIARRLGISVSGTKSRVQRARRLLAESLRACCEIAIDQDGRAVDFERRGGC